MHILTKKKNYTKKQNQACKINLKKDMYLYCTYKQNTDLNFYKKCFYCIIAFVVCNITIFLKYFKHKSLLLTFLFVFLFDKRMLKLL